MEIIKKQNKFITNEKHLEYLQRLKRNNTKKSHWMSSWNQSRPTFK